MSDELKPQSVGNDAEFQDLAGALYNAGFYNESIENSLNALIAHIDAWGARLADDAVQPKQLIDAVSIMLWLYRRLPQAYGRPPFVEQPIAALAEIVGIEVDECFNERGAAPTPKEDA